MRLYIIFCIFIILFGSCKRAGDDIKTFPSNVYSMETNLMVDSLKAIKDRTNFRNHPYESAEKLKLIEVEVNAAKVANTLSMPLYLEYAKTLLYAGRSQDAIIIFEDILKKFPQNQEINATTKTFHEVIAMAYLRMGEQQNCIENHSSESCLFPIKGKGIHTNQDGSRKAITVYEKMLASFPNDLQSRWLLNLAYMTIDEYPNNVPIHIQIPKSLLQSEYEIKPFENIAMDLGVDVNGLAGGIILDDFNNDGFVDLVVSSWGMFGKLNYFINDGEGHFIEKTEVAGLAKLTGGLNLIQADYNNDGFLDFYVLRGAWKSSAWMGLLPNSLIKNNGDGTFTDVTISSGMYAEYPTQSAVWSDFNADGWLDMFVGNETQNLEEIHPCQLYINQKNGTFKDVARDVGLNFALYVKGVASGDVNNDGWPDLYLSLLNGSNRLLLNKGIQTNGNPIFDDITSKAGVSEPLESFPTWFFDYDNDGWEDLFVSCFDQNSFSNQAGEVAADYLGLKSNSDWPRLYRNDHNGVFTNVTKKANLQHILPTMGCNFGDIDNDGWLDFYLGTGAPDYRAVVPNRMFRNDQGKAFLDVTTAGNVGHIQKGHGIGFADLDNDGDQDIYAVLGGSYSGDVYQNALFENPGNEKKWITIRLEGTKSNRNAIGARIRITIKEMDGLERTIFNTVTSGGSFGSNSLQAEIGLGNAKEIKNIEVAWPNGKFKYIPYGPTGLNQFVNIREGDIKINVLNQKMIHFSHLEHGNMNMH